MFSIRIRTEDIMRIIAHIHPGPAWLAGHTVFEQGPVMDGHLAFMRARFDDGTLLVGGPLATEECGFALLEAADLTTARDLVGRDPAARADVLVYELHQILPYFDALSGARADGAAKDQARRLATPA
jgi:uncharacterized protein YciI